MNHSNLSVQNGSLSIARKEKGVSTHVPITHFNSPEILEAHNGMMFAVIQLKGVPFDTETTSTLNQYKRTWHNILSNINENFALIETRHRRRENIDLVGDFTNDFAKSIDQAYHSQFKDEGMYVNDIYLTVIYKGLTTGKVGKGLSLYNKLQTMFQKIDHESIKQARRDRRKQQIKKLNDVVFQLMTSLSAFSPRRLGEQDEDKGYSEMLSFISLFVNGGEALKFKGMESASALDKTLAESLKSHQRYPFGNLAQFITAKRIFFGDYIQFQGTNKADVRFAAMVSIKRYSTSTASVMLDPLMHLDCEYLSTNSFLIESKTEADKVMTKEIARRENVNDPAKSQTMLLTDAQDDLASDRINMGYHHNTLMLMADSIAELDSQVAQAIKCYMDAGFVAVRETLGQENAFWAQIPTNSKHIARSSLISSENFVDFAPLHNYRTGYRDQNHLKSAVTLIETPSRTPLFFNLHARDRYAQTDNPTSGHTTLIGGNGSGKTAMMCFIDAQMNRYHGRTFALDRNRGMEIYIRACGGYYATLSPSYAKEIQFNPFALPNTEKNKKFCKELMIQMIKNNEDEQISADLSEIILASVNYVFDQLEPKHRNLSNAANMIPDDFPRWANLRQWLRGTDKRAAGEYAYLFDNDEDALLIHDKMGFDMTHFLDNEPPHILAAVSMYLFHRLDSSLDGRLVSVLLDEGWQYLKNKEWENKMRDWLPTLRKANCHIVFATQSPKTVVDSPISHIILENTATNIYFSNPQAKREDYIDGFKLSETEYQCIQKNSIESRLFLYKQAHESSLGRLNLAGLKNLLTVLSGTIESSERVAKIREEWGEDPAIWLPKFYQSNDERRLAQQKAMSQQR